MTWVLVVLLYSGATELIGRVERVLPTAAQCEAAAAAQWRQARAAPGPGGVIVWCEARR